MSHGFIMFWTCEKVVEVKPSSVKAIGSSSIFPMNHKTCLRRRSQHHSTVEPGDFICNVHSLDHCPKTKKYNM